MKAAKKQEELTMNEFGLKDAANCPEMWPGGSWQQWPLQPSMFQNIPHEQIDWAALAQQWIQMRETRGDGSSNDQPPPPMIGGNVHIPPRPVDSNKQMKLENTVESLDEGSNSQDTNSFRQGDWNYWGNSNWSVNNPPPPAWNASLHANEAKESLPPYEFGQAHGNQGFAAQSYDYNHGSDQYGYNQVYVEQNQFNQYWPGGQSGAIFPRKEHRLQIPEREGIPPIREDEEMAAMTSNLDAAKRKQLPAWIREGLEKMEREKQKRLEKERLLKEREGQLKSMKEAEERAMKEFMNDRGGESLIPRKSKFDSDSEEEEEEDLPKKSPSPLKRKYSSGEEEEDDEPKSDEEKLADLMMRVRQLLTEILLEVTNEEVTQIAKEVLNRAKAKAPAMQLASSSALASITRGLGLAEYGTDESENSGGEGDDAVDSDVDLQASINQRKKEFTEKEKEIVAGLKSEDSDIDLEEKQIGCDFIQPTSEREKYHFEKKYNEIPGLDVAPLPDENSTIVQEISIKVEKDLESKQSTDKSITNNSSSESDSERDSRTSSSSRGRETCWKSVQNEKSQRRDRNRSSSRERDRRDDRRRRSRSRDRRRSRSSSRSRRSRNFNRDRSDSRDRRSSYGSRSSRDWNSRKERSRRSRSTSHSSTRRQRRDRGRRNSRSYSRSRSRSPRKYSSRRGRENSRRESRSPSGEGSGKKSSRKQTT